MSNEACLDMNDGDKELDTEVVYDDKNEMIEEGESNNMDIDSEENEQAVLNLPEKNVKELARVRQFAVRMNEKAKCNFCERLISCKDGNTSNISNHILNVHGDLKDIEKFRAMQKEKKNKLKLK